MHAALGEYGLQIFDNVANYLRDIPDKEKAAMQSAIDAYKEAHEALRSAFKPAEKKAAEDFFNKAAVHLFDMIQKAREPYEAKEKIVMAQASAVAAQKAKDIRMLDDFLVQIDAIKKCRAQIGDDSSIGKNLAGRMDSIVRYEKVYQPMREDLKKPGENMDPMARNAIQGLLKPSKEVNAELAKLYDPRKAELAELNLQRKGQLEAFRDELAITPKLDDSVPEWKQELILERRKIMRQYVRGTDKYFEGQPKQTQQLEQDLKFELPTDTSFALQSKMSDERYGKLKGFFAWWKSDEDLVLGKLQAIDLKINPPKEKRTAPTPPPKPIAKEEAPVDQKKAELVQLFQERLDNVEKYRNYMMDLEDQGRELDHSGSKEKKDFISQRYDVVAEYVRKNDEDFKDQIEHLGNELFADPASGISTERYAELKQYFKEWKQDEDNVQKELGAIFNKEVKHEQSAFLQNREKTLEHRGSLQTSKGLAKEEQESQLEAARQKKAEERASTTRPVSGGSPARKVAKPLPTPPNKTGGPHM